MTSRIVKPVRRLSMVMGLIGFVLLVGSAARAAEPRVVVLPTTGIVDQVMAGYLRDRVDDAAASDATAVIVRLDTPGGSLEATRAIVGTLLDAPVPVIVWVAPSGARAASAGTFITLAANLAYMAPGTNMGAASPIGGGGEDIGGTLGDKVKNDAIALMTSIAQARGRDVAAAVDTVENATSYTAQRAIDLGLVDGFAADLPAVLAAIDGRSVEVRGRELTLETAGAATIESGMNPFEVLLHLLSDPNIAFILFTVGFYGLIFELQNPNFVTGILGALAIILALVGSASLPLNVGGLLLIGLAGILFMLELTVTSHGLLTVGGLVCLGLGAAALYTGSGSPTAPDVTVAMPVIVAMVGTTGGFMLIIIAAAIRSRRMRPAPGTVGAVFAAGAVGEVRNPLEPQGTVYVWGEEWSARSVDERPVQRGVSVRVIRQEGLTVIVEPADPGGSAS